MAPDVTNNDDPASLFPPEPREHLINTAVKFLTNPRVRPSSLSHKQKFLKQKGLTDEEIERACQKAGAFEDEKNNLSGPMVMARPYYEKPSIWIKAKDVANLVALFSIGSYSLYSLWKRYIAPRLFGTRSRNEQNYQSLLAAISELNRNVLELKELIRELQGPPGSSLQRARQAYEIQEIKNELTSIKGLLLNRSQFPTITHPSSGGSSGIPSWQMVQPGGGPGGDDEPGLDDSNEDDSNGSRRRVKVKSQKISGGRKTGQGDEVLSEAGSAGGSSCEVVFVGGKNDSEPDHSDD